MLRSVYFKKNDSRRDGRLDSWWSRGKSQFIMGGGGEDVEKYKTLSWRLHILYAYDATTFDEIVVVYGPVYTKKTTLDETWGYTC